MCIIEPMEAINNQLGVIMETSRISVLRKNGFSVSKSLMVKTSIIAPVPFSVNGKQAVSKNGSDYRMTISGHYKDATPYTFVF